MAAPVVRSVTTEVAFPGSTSAVYDKPTGTVEGDLLVAAFLAHDGFYGTVDDLTPPAGWTTITELISGNAPIMGFYYRIAGAAEGSTYTWSINDGSNWEGAIVCVEVGTFNATTPIGTTSGVDFARQFQAGSSTSVSAPTVTPPQDECLGLAFFAAIAGQTWTPPTSWTEIADATNTGPSIHVASDTLGTGATGSITATASAAAAANQVGAGVVVVRSLLAPAAPTIFFQAGGHERAGIEWTAGVDGGSPVTDWDIDAAPASAPTSWIGVQATGSTLLYGAYTGLTNGTAYVFRVRGVNAVGDGVWSSTSGSATSSDVRGSFLLESGDKFLLENGDEFLLESGAADGNQEQTLTGSITAAGALTKSTSKALASTATPTGLLVKLAAKVLGGSVSPSGALEVLRTITQSLSGSITATGALLRSVGRTLAGSVTGSGSIVKDVAKGPYPVDVLDAAIMALSPLGYWKLDETSGTTAIDSSGNGRHGTYSGTVTLADEPGPDGFDYPTFGGGEVVIADDTVFTLGTTPGLSFFVLMKPSVINAFKMIISKGADSNYEWQLYLGLGATGRLLFSSFSPTASSELRREWTVSNPLTTDWQAVLATRAGALNSDPTQFFHNSDSALTNDTPLTQSGTNSDGTSPVSIGYRADAPGSSLAYAGAMAHVVALAGVPSAGEITAVMNAANLWLAGDSEGVGGIGGSITPSGALSQFRVVVQALAGSITAAGALVKMIGKAAFGSTAPSGTPANLTSKGLDGEIEPTGSLTTTRLLAQLLTGAITAAGVLVKAVSKAAFGSTAPSGQPANLTSKGLDGSVTPSGSLSTSRVIAMLLSGSITASGALAKGVGKTLVGGITAVGFIAKLVGKLLGGSITGSGTLVTEGGTPNEPGEICAYVDVGVIDAYVDCPQMQAYVDVGIIDATVG